MGQSLKPRHDIPMRENAAILFEKGLGYRSVATALSLPSGTVKNWCYMYASVGREGLMSMGSSHNAYTFELKLAVAKATEQVFGHIKDEFFRNQKWPSFEEFKRDLDAYIVHWNTKRRQVKLKGLTPEEFRNQSLAA